MDSNSPEAAPPSFLHSVDFRILQYRYNAIKLGTVVRSLRRVISDAESRNPAALTTQATQTTQTTHTNPPAEPTSPSISSAITDAADSIRSSVSLDSSTFSGTLSESTQSCSFSETTTSSNADNGPSLDASSCSSSLAAYSNDVPAPLFALPLVQYVVLSTSPAFAINSSAFQKRLELLAQFKLFRSMPIQISPSPTHIPYDQPDIGPYSLHDLPLLSIALKCLKALASLAEIAIQGYGRKLAQVKAEREASIGAAPDGHYDKIDKVVLEVLDCDDDLDLTLGDMSVPILTDILHEDYAASALVDMDVKMLLVLSRNMQRTLGRLSTRIKELRRMTDSQLAASYGLHQTFLLTLRLNELGAVFRHFGRNAYFANSQHLHYQKFLSMNKNPNYFKQVALRGVEDMFAGPKVNGALVANLTRLLRHGSRHEVNAKNVLEFTKYVGQSIDLLRASSIKVGEFALGWLFTEIKYRKEMDIPHAILHVIRQELGRNADPAENGLGVKNAPAARPLSQSRLAVRPGNGQANGSAKARTGIVAAGAVTTTTSVKAVALKKPRSDLAGLSENGRAGPSLRKMQNSDSASDTSSISSISSLLSTASAPRTLVSTIQAKHRLHKCSSEDTLPVASTGANPSVTVGRARSNSQPIAKSECMATRAAIGSVRAAGASQRAESQPLPASSKRSSKMSLSQSLDSATQGNSSLHPVEEELAPKPKMLSAQQKFNQRIREAAKSGSLVTQPKDSLATYIYDPARPDPRQANGHKPKREPPQANDQSVKDALPCSTSDPQTTVASSPDPGPKPTRVLSVRDTITRRNTRKNSVSAPAPSALEMTASDESMPPLVKKVRFTGIPPYNEAEEALANFASKILKGFPQYTPSTLQFKCKDRMLRKEESLEFRHQLHDSREESQPSKNFSDQVSAQLAVLAIQQQQQQQQPLAPPRKPLSRLRKLL